MTESIRKRPRTARGKRILERKEPKIFEDPKQIVFFNTTTASKTVRQALSDLYTLLKSNATYLHHKKEAHPFDNEEPLVALAAKTDSGLFMTGYDTKKRPDTLLFGRLFDQHVLDMFELQLVQFVPMDMSSALLPSPNSPPLLLFQGEAFVQDENFVRLKSALTDFFHNGQPVPKIYFHPHAEHTGLEYVISFTVLPDSRTVFCRTDRIILLKSETQKPQVSLHPIGPHMVFSLQRTKSAGESLQHQAYKKPRSAQPKKVKNVTRDSLGDKYGRVHLPRQDLKNLVTRHVKALRKPSQK
jgi:ribosome production factor 2